MQQLIHDVESGQADFNLVLVYDVNRISFKLKKHRVSNEPDMWIKKEGAFEGIVPPEVFYTAQGILRARAHRYSNEELIEKLRNLYQNRGYLSGLIIDETEGMPSASAYIHRFGSLIRAYQAVGYTPDRDYRFLEINQYRLAPAGFNQDCNRTANATNPMPSPQSWYESAKAKGQDVRLELVEGGGHGMMFADFSATSKQLPGGRMFYIAHGARADTRAQLQKLVLEFIESKL